MHGLNISRDEMSAFGTFKRLIEPNVTFKLCQRPTGRANKMLHCADINLRMSDMTTRNKSSGSEMFTAEHN